MLTFITIPITARGISDQNFESAQYLTNKLLETAITATMLIWLMKLLIQSHAICLTYFNSGINNSFDKLIVFNLLTYQTFNAKVINWLIIVAYAAQAIQRLKLKMNNASRIVFITAHIIIEIMANFGFQSALMMEFKEIQIIKNGIQRMIMAQ